MKVKKFDALIFYSLFKNLFNTVSIIYFDNKLRIYLIFYLRNLFKDLFKNLLKGLFKNLFRDLFKKFI